MKIRHHILAIIMSATTSVASAVNVDLTAPGSLSTTLSDTPASVKELTITGTMDATDFDFINRELTALETLNLSGVTIAAYNGDEVLMNRRRFAANTLPAYSLAGTKVANIVLPKSIKEIGDGALASTSISSLTLPEGVTTIGEGAFSGCTTLKSVSIPSTVTTMGDNTFSRCTALETVTLSCPIPARAFLGCSALKSVSLGNESGVKTIGDYAFAGCTSLSSFPFRGGLTSVGTSAFEGSGLTAVDLSASSSLTSLGAWAFAKCDKLTSVIFNDKLTTLGEGIFLDDASLVTVALPTGVTSLPDYSFKGATSIDSEAFMHSFITSIGNYATMGMTRVSVFTLPASLTHIGDEAMAGWESLTALHAEDLSVVPELGNDVWKDVDQSKATLYAKGQLANEFSTTPQWQEFNITLVTGIDDVVADTPAANRVKAWFTGTDLNLQADTEIINVALYGITGMQYLSATPYDTRFSIDTAGLGERVYIVRIRLDDDSVVTLKLAR